MVSRSPRRPLLNLFLGVADVSHSSRCCFCCNCRARERGASERGGTRPTRSASAVAAAASTSRRAAAAPAPTPPAAYASVSLLTSIVLWFGGAWGLYGGGADNWSVKAIRRKTTGTGRMRYLRHVPRRFKSNFREGDSIFWKQKFYFNLSSLILRS